MPTEPVSPALREAVSVRALTPEPDDHLEDAVQELALAARGALEGAVYFGSRRTGAAKSNEWSAYDLFVVVHRYRPFYDAMRSAGLSGKGGRLMAVVSRMLPPTQYSIRFEGSPVHVKAAVIEADAFYRETSQGRKDHFCLGRLFQPSRILYARDAATRQRLLDALVSAHRATWDWSRPWLPPVFDAAAYGSNALQVSMSWEVRPEPPSRALSLWEAQAGEQVPVLQALLADLGSRGEIIPAGEEGAGSWRVARRVTRAETWRLKLYFRRSIARSTARWLKHVLSFEGWLEYILRKANRHSDAPIELTERERRWPLVFLWPRVLRHLRERRH